MLTVSAAAQVMSDAASWVIMPCTCSSSCYGVADEALLPLESSEQHVFDIIDSTLRQYLAEGRDEPVADFTFTTPFMDAGLDSLDLLKVSPAHVT